MRGFGRREIAYKQLRTAREYSDVGNVGPVPLVKEGAAMMTTRFSDTPVPSWARAILFWRKVVAVQRGGIPGSLSGPNGCLSR